MAPAKVGDVGGCPSLSTGCCDDDGPPSIDLGSGRRLDLRDLLGEGGSATVYRALLSSDGNVCRSVAVKVLPALSSDDDQIRGFLMEIVRRVACVDHPNVARVYECGLWRNQPFVVSELVDGVPLIAFCDAYAAKHRRVPLDAALFIASEVGEALTGAHAATDHYGVPLGVLHHNLSTREVLLSSHGEVKVTDFELGKLRAAASSIRPLRGVAGRATTMAPEVAQGIVGDERSDVFSFGVLLRELFVGPRFPAGLTNAEAVRLARAGYVQPMTFQPRLPEGLAGIMERALEVDPEARYPNASVMAESLRRVAFAMGVGDGRYFLRSTLEREWATSA